MTITNPSQLHQRKPRITHIIIFCAGLLLLAASWLVLYWWIALFTEAMLVPWYCCATEALPPPGAWQRTINDFSYTFPGSVLPSAIFIAISAVIFTRRLLRARMRVWLPLSFFLANVLLFAAGTAVVEASWAVSNTIAGPRLGGIDAGFHRTWYGIVSQLFLCFLFFFILAKAKPTSSSELR